MKGSSIRELAAQLVSIKDTSKDFLVPVSEIEAYPDERNGGVRINLDKNVTRHHVGPLNFALNNWSHGQLAEYADVPSAYYRRINAENPSLLAENINHGLSKVKDQTRMIRTSGQIPTVRALVSDKYKRMDSFDMLEAILPMFQEQGLELHEGSVTDRNFYLKVLSPKLKGEVKVGDPIQYGFSISNSDVGSGSRSISEFFSRLVCTNGMIGQVVSREFHMGKRLSNEDFFSQNTRDVSDTASYLQMKDTIAGLLSESNFEKRLEVMKEAAGLEIKSKDIPGVIELTLEKVGYHASDELKNSFLAQLASGNEGAGLTKWGLVNSLTAIAKDDAIDYEETIALQKAAGRVLELPRRVWEEIAKAV